MSLELGKVYNVTVSRIIERGVVVAVSGYSSTGFIHISEISDKYVTSISDFVTVGETYEAICIDTVKASFSLKPLKLSPRSQGMKESTKEQRRKDFAKRSESLTLDDMIARANASLADKQRCAPRPQQRPANGSRRKPHRKKSGGHNYD